VHERANGMGGGAEILDARERIGSGPRLNPLAEANGLVRDVLAAVRNLENLLRSPLVGPRALAPVIPGLSELCVPLQASVEEIHRYVQATAATSTTDAVHALADQIRATCDRLRLALEQAGASAMDAKARLAFEAEVQDIGGDLNSVRQLMTLLALATDGPAVDMDLDVREVVREVFATASRREPRVSRQVDVTVSFAGDSFALKSRAQVVMPLIGIGLALVHRSVAGPLSLDVISQPGHPPFLVISGRPGHTGESQGFEPPPLTAPSLLCAETAARLIGVTYDMRPERLTIAWAVRQGPGSRL
jgi:hypothetical protein